METVPIVISNEDDAPASVEVNLRESATGKERRLMEPFQLAPGETKTLHPDREFDGEGFQLLINDILVVSGSGFGGCEPADVADAISGKQLDLVVGPDGVAEFCPGGGSN